jgi:uncharacterized protein (DUF2062 family)
LVRRTLRSVVRLRGSSRAIAGGFAIGVFIAFTPTIGFQMLLAAFVATLLGVNRPATILSVWITNPATIPPVYLFTYKVGRLCWTVPHPQRIGTQLGTLTQRLQEHGVFEIHNRFSELLRLGADTFIALLIGGVVVGLACAVPSYFAVLRLVRSFRRRRKTASLSTGRE